MVGEAWFTGKTNNSTMLTCGGRDADQTISSAISSAVTEEASVERCGCQNDLTWLKTFVYFGGGGCITAKSDEGKSSLNHAW